MINLELALGLLGLLTTVLVGLLTNLLYDSAKKNLGIQYDPFPEAYNNAINELNKKYRPSGTQIDIFLHRENVKTAIKENLENPNSNDFLKGLIDDFLTSFYNDNFSREYAKSILSTFLEILNIEIKNGSKPSRKDIIGNLKKNPSVLAIVLVILVISFATASMVLNSIDDSASNRTVLESMLPVANFSVNSTSGYAPMDVIFTDNSINSIYKWWNFGDGIGTGSSVNPINHTYFKAGKYKVYLKVTNAVGNNTSGPTCITVNEIFYAFDPNNGNDGKSPWGESLSSLPSYETYHLPSKEGYIIVESQYDFIDDTKSNYSDSDPTDGNGFYISILSPDKGHWSWNGSYTPEKDSTKGLIPGSEDHVGIIGKDGEKNMPSGKGTKLRVYSPYTRMTVIAVVGDNGPAPYTGCQFGASNKVFKALGLPDSYNGSSKENPNPGYASNKSDPEKYPVIKYADNPYWVEVSWADQSLPAGPLKLGNKSR
jgi:PKD repeat protein